MIQDGILTGINLTLEIAKEIIKRTPDYNQSKRKALYKLELAYQNELTKEYRDDALIDDLKDQIEIYLRNFLIDLRGK